MKPRQIVLCGLVITALCTALLVSDYIPAMVVGVFALGLGMVLSYYIALSQQRGNMIGETETQDRILDKIQSQVDTEGALRQLCIWSNWLAASEDALLWLEGTGVIAQTNPGSGAEWTVIAGEIEYSSRVLELSRHMVFKLSAALDPAWEALTVVNDTLDDGRRLVLFLVDPARKVQEAILFRLLHDTRYILERDIKGRGVTDEYKRLARIAVNASEQKAASFIGHGERVQSLALLLGQRLHLPDEEMKVLEYAALIHDIGKAMDLEEADSGQDDNSEMETAQGAESEVPAADHASLGARLIPDEGYWREVREAVLYHHERYDGSGYPRGLKQYDIPQAARIIAVADVYDALTALATEEERVDAATAVAVIKRATGIWFDPLVVVALEEIDPTYLGRSGDQVNPPCCS